MDIPGAISAITAALGLARELRQIDVNLEKAELKLKLADITEALAEAKVALTEASLRISELERAAAAKSTDSQHIARLSKQGELYYDGPVAISNAKCPHCVEVKRLVVGLHVEPFDQTILACSNCKNSYSNPFFEMPSSYQSPDYDPF